MIKNKILPLEKPQRLINKYIKKCNLIDSDKLTINFMFLFIRLFRKKMNHC